MLVVIVIIGILATLAYSNLIDLIFTNRAKETAQTIRTFTERALIDAKRKNEVVTIALPAGGNSITATFVGTPVSEALGMGYKPADIAPVSFGSNNSLFKNSVTSELRLGLSGISKEGYLVACDTRNYCAGAVKTKTENSFRAYIRKGKNANWEAL